MNELPSKGSRDQRRAKKLRPGDLVTFVGDQDWIWVDTQPYEESSDGDDPMFMWDRLTTVGTVVSGMMFDGYFCYVKLLIDGQVGYYYADQLRLVG